MSIAIAEQRKRWKTKYLRLHPDGDRISRRKYYQRNKQKCYLATLKWKKEHPEKEREYYKKYYGKVKAKRLKDRYYTTEKYLKWKRDYNARFPEKRIAINKANQAVIYRRLKIEKQCQKCKKITKLQKHHSDYSKPLQVDWLCPSCHKQLHLNGRL